MWLPNLNINVNITADDVPSIFAVLGAIFLAIGLLSSPPNGPAAFIGFVLLGLAVKTRHE